jgi:hypothetical protein
MDSEATGIFKLAKETPDFAVYHIRVGKDTTGSLYFKRGRGLIPEKITLTKETEGEGSKE